MRIGIIGDSHLGCTDFSSKRRADFSAAFCNAIQTCLNNGAETICLLGDVFDSAATRRSVDAFSEILKEIGAALCKLKNEGVPLIAIPGNHEFGRGREAGELTSLESLGLVRVLRASDFTCGSVRICGIPWQHDPAEVPRLARRLSEGSRARHEILLLHNFVKGSKHIPAQLGEVDSECFNRFGKVFVGHHHIYESVANCVIPGSTEIQNMLDQSEKCVVVYDCETDTVTAHRLPRTHRVAILGYDISSLSASELLSSIARDLDSNGGCAGAFVYLRLTGSVRADYGVSKSELLALLRERELFDYYIDVRYSTQSKTAAESKRGASIEQILRRTFRAGELAKAKRYLEYSESEQLFADIREDILSDRKKSEPR